MVNNCAPKIVMITNVVVEVLAAVLIKDLQTETKVVIAFQNLRLTKLVSVEEETKLAARTA